MEYILNIFLRTIFLPFAELNGFNIWEITLKKEKKYLRTYTKRKKKKKIVSDI